MMTLGRVLRRTFLIVASFALLLCLEKSAVAFCRTTTCDPASGDECRKNDDGCVRDGVPLVWKTMPIVYRFHGAGSSKLDNSGARAVIRRAFDEWENVECERGRTSLRFQEGPDIKKDKPLGDKEAPEKFGIYFRDDEWPHEDADESLALTNQIYGKVTGTIDYADIEINTFAVDFRLTDEDAEGTDLQAVVTHEVGHYIGLAHSLDEDSIMVSRYCQNSTTRCGESIDKKRALSEDDISAVCAAYEPPRRATEPPTGCATCTQASSPTSTKEITGAGVLVFLVSAILRRRRLS